MSQWLIDFPPQAAQLPEQNPAWCDVRGDWPVVVFEAGSERSVHFSSTVPPEYRGQNLEVTVLAAFSGDTQVSHQAELEVAFERVSAEGGNVRVPQWGPGRPLRLAVPSEEGKVVAGTAVFSNSEVGSLRGGELFRLRLRLRASGSNFVGRLELVRVTVRPAN
jgi:hypothetical protein